MQSVKYHRYEILKYKVLGIIKKKVEILYDKALYEKDIDSIQNGRQFNIL